MLRSFTQAATVLHVSQPARTAKIKKDAAQLGLLSGRRRMERNLLPIAERVLDPNTVQFDVQTGPLERRGLDADRRAAALLLQPATSRLPRKGRSSSIIARGRGRAETGCLDSNRSACRRYFTGMIIGYPFGVITVITHLCTSVLLALDAQ